MRAAVITLVVVIGVGGLPAASAQDVSLDLYAAIVEQYRSDPNRAIEQATALSPAAFSAAPSRAGAEQSHWTFADVQAAMLMHLEAALVLNKRGDVRAWAHIRTGQDLGQTLGRSPDHAWFVHRWHTIVARLFAGSVRFTPVRRSTLPWKAAIASFEAGLRFEYRALKPPRLFPGLDARTYDPPDLGRALSNFESAASEGLLVAALHAGRLRMLRGDDTRARRLFKQALKSSTPSTCYLAHLFLGAMDERDQEVASAEHHYLGASSILPYAQSGRVALASLLARSGRGKEAAIVVSRMPPGNLERLSFDPWWLYFPPDPFEPAATLTGMYAEVQK